jgi:RHS repeat-associated protein
VNQVLYEYNTQGQLSNEYSSTTGAVDTSSTPYIGYTYDTTKSGTLYTKSLRPTSVIYPGGRTINYEYGIADSNDDILNRFTAVKDGATTLVQYVDNGVSTPVKVTYPQPNLVLDYTISSALNRFNQVTDHAWKKDTADIVHIKHGYDRVGNRLYREDVAATANNKAFDELYAYDGVNQLVDMQRGTLNSTKTDVTSKGWEENFAFDATGNWNTFKQDTNGNGTWDLNQSRTHNKANEIVTIAGSSNLVASDQNGNMTKVPKPETRIANYNLVYDAWNRLVEVRDSDNSTKIAEYSYNGLNHRVVKKTYTSGTLTETRNFYFNRSWQCLEERVGSTVEQTYVWGLRYIDDLVCRDKGAERLYSIADTNWNVVALCDTSGTVQERYAYDAFGKRNVFDADFTLKNVSDYNWSRAFTGQVLDVETGLMVYRNRFYHTGLGRFLSRDTLGYDDDDDENVYRYAINKPNSFVDPQGDQMFPPMYNSNDLYGQISISSLPSIKIRKNVPQGKKQHPTKKFETNGCTLVPDKVPGADFTPICNAHDICYETCGNSKSDCDSQFYIDMVNTCMENTKQMKQMNGNRTSGGITFCQIAAGRYLQGVQTSCANAAYNKSQKDYCVDEC